MYRFSMVLLLVTMLASCATYERRVVRPGSITPHKGTQKPYVVNGERYEPLSSHEGFAQSGNASWYGNDFHGKRTSNGETYDMYAMTAAHKTLPMGVYVRVHNRDNGRESVVRINDRGPFVAGRIIDLSYAAAKDLGVIAGGTAPVRIEALGYPDDSVKGRVAYRAPASYDRGSFGIQVGSFSQRTNAQKLAESVRQRYGVASIQEADVNGVHYFRVRAGNYPSLKEVEQIRERSSDKLIASGFIVALD